jgi:hypothetical protein
MIVFSCIQEPDSPKIEVHESSQIAKVKAWFEENKTNLRLPERGSNFRTESQELILPFFEKEPDWDKFHHYYFADGREVFEVNLKNKQNFLPISDKSLDKDKIAKRSIQNILFVKHATEDRFDPLIVRYYPDEENSKRNFKEINYQKIDEKWSGWIDLFTYDEHNFIGFQVEKGQITHTRTFQKEGQNAKKSIGFENKDVRCTIRTVDWYSGYTGLYIGTTYHEQVCSIDGPSGPIGSPTYSYGEYYGISYGSSGAPSDYTVPDVPLPRLSISNGISKENFPCLSSAADKSINKDFSNEITNLILDIFGESEDFHIYIEAYPEAPTVDGTCNFSSNYADYSAGTFTITINTLLENSSQEYVMVTIFHEFLHAYLGYLNLPILPDGGPEHEEMAKAYAGNLSAILVNEFGIRKDQALALSWGGLQETTTYGDKTDTEKNYISQINQAYRNGSKGTKCN